VLIDNNTNPASVSTIWKHRGFQGFASTLEASKAPVYLRVSQIIP